MSLMTPLTRPRGPLPARVYWTRRLVLLAVSVLLVAGIARMLGSGSDASSDPDQAAPVAADPSATEGSGQGASAGTTRGPGASKAASVKPTPAQPDGPCVDEDIVATPLVGKADAGKNSLITLELTTREAAACTWRVSSQTLTVKITSGPDEIWFSRHCPQAIPTRDLIVRKEIPVKVAVRWSGRRSDAECSALTEWAMPGGYHVEAAALAGEPSEAYFELATPAGAVVTRTVTPSPKPTRGPRASQGAGGGSDDESGTRRPGARPSGAVEPNG